MDIWETVAKERLEIENYNKKKARKAFSRIFLASAIYLIISYAIIIGSQFLALYILGRDKAGELFSNPYFSYGLQIVAMYVFAFPVFLLITMKMPRVKIAKEEDLSDLTSSDTFEHSLTRQRRRLSLGEFMILFFVCSAAMTVGAYISNIITSFISTFRGQVVENATSEFISSVPIWLVILLTVILAPIIEEIIFRKVFIDVLGVYGDRLAILVSAIAFGIFHGNFSQVVYAALVGLIFGYIYTKTRRIKYTIFLHMLLNAFGTLPSLLLGDSLDRISSITEDTALVGKDALVYIGDLLNVFGLLILQYGLAIAGIVIFIVATVKKRYSIPKRCDVRIPSNCVAKTVLLNVGAILFLILIGLEFLLSVF